MLDDPIRSLLISWGVNAELAGVAAILIVLAVLGIAAWIADILTRRILVSTLVRFARHSRATWDDELVEHGVLHQLAHLVPTLLIYLALPTVLAEDAGSLVEPLQRLTLVVLAVVVVVTINRVLNALLATYDRTRVAAEVPLRPIVQMIQGVVVFAALILLVAMLINRSAVAILGGLGAFTAVLLLVFQQPILGLTAGIQLSANRMIRRGDWITVPKFGADGTVVDITLTTVSVQNWDKTISAVPTHALLTDTFRNWRGMQESGGRRVKRAINIDMATIRFMDADLRERMGRLRFLREYLEEREKEIAEYNRENDIDDSSPANGRRLTNVGTFRAYLIYYLKAHPLVSQELTFLVRQLDPTPQGLPIEVYVFLTEQRWAEYEAIQADIFDHILAVVPEFGLRVYQQPSGRDLEQLRIQPSTS